MDLVSSAHLSGSRTHWDISVANGPVVPSLVGSGGGFRWRLSNAWGIFGILANPWVHSWILQMT